MDDGTIAFRSLRRMLSALRPHWLLVWEGDVGRGLELLLAEPHPTPALALVAELGLLSAISPELEWTDEVQSMLMEIEGQLNGNQAAITLHHCPIRSVCLLRKMEIDGQICQMFHYYMAGILAEIAGCPARPRGTDLP